MQIFDGKCNESRRVLICNRYKEIDQPLDVTLINYITNKMPHLKNFKMSLQRHNSQNGY